MKHLIQITTFATVVATAPSLFGSVAEAQPDPGDRRTAITIGPVSLALGIVNVEVDRALAPRVSLFIEPRVLVYDVVYQSDVRSVGIDGGLRFYMYGRAPEGLWLSTQAGFAYAWDSGGSTADGAGFVVGGSLGYSLVTPRGFAFSPSFGAGYSSIEVQDGNGDSYGHDGFTLLGRLGIGYAF